MATRSAFSIRYSNPDANTSAKVELRLIRHRSSRAKSQVSKSGSCNRYSGTPASLQVVPPHPAFPSHIPQLSIHLDLNYLKDLKISYPVSLLLKCGAGIYQTPQEIHSSSSARWWRPIPQSSSAQSFSRGRTGVAPPITPASGSRSLTAVVRPFVTSRVTTCPVAASNA